MRGRALQVVLTLGGGALAGCGDTPLSPAPDVAAVAATITEFTASDVPVGVLDPGVLEFLPDRIVWHGLALRARFDASDPRFSGFMDAELNAVWNLAGEGPVRGTFALEVDDGGRWEGVWRARRSQTAADQWVGEATWTARGVAGSVTGLHAEGAETIVTTELFPSFYVGQVVGRIRERS